MEDINKSEHRYRMPHDFTEEDEKFLAELDGEESPFYEKWFGKKKESENNDVLKKVHLNEKNSIEVNIDDIDPESGFPIM